MKTNLVDVRNLEIRKFQFLDGTEKYPEFYVKAAITGMVYIQNGKLCRLEAIASDDSNFNTEIEATIHFGGKAYDLEYDEDIEILAKRLGCRPFSIQSIRSLIRQEISDARASLVHDHQFDDLNETPNTEFSVEIGPFNRLNEYGSEAEYDCSLKIGDRIIPVNRYWIDQGDYGYAEVTTFDLGDNTKIRIVDGNSDYALTTTGRENYEEVLKLEKLLGLKPGDGMKIFRSIDWL